MKNEEFIVTVELETVEYRISAKNATEARQKALKRLDRKKPSNLVDKQWDSGRKKIWIDKW